MSDKPTREQLAEYAHEAWAGWMKYLFEQTLHESITGGEIIPLDLVQRWQRQMNTPYADLPENEKESDRAEADKMLAIIQANEPPLWYKMGYDEESVRQGDTE